MVDGSNESLEHADQEYDPILRKGVTLQNSFEKVDVWYPFHMTMEMSVRSMKSNWETGIMAG